MDSEKAIYILRILHTSVNERLFSEIFGSNYGSLLQTWYINDQNAIEFLRYIERDNKIKFWNFVKRLGINKLENLKEAYSIISVIYQSFNELETEDDLPILEILNKYSLDNMVRFLVDISEDDLKVLVEWCKSWLIDLELEKAKIAPICFYKKKDFVVENKPSDVAINAKVIKLRSQVNPFQNPVNNRPVNVQLRKFSTTPRYVSLKYKLNPSKPNILNMN